MYKRHKLLSLDSPGFLHLESCAIKDGGTQESQHYASTFSRLKKLGIRHPPPLPFLGNLLFFRNGYWDAHSKLINEYGPACGYYIGHRMYMLISDPDMIKQILVDNFESFSNRMNPGLSSKPILNSLVGLRDERWKNVRSQLTPSFGPAKIKEMTPLIHQACDTLLSNLKVYANSGTDFDIERNYACFSLDIAASVAFGTYVDSQKNPNEAIVKNMIRVFEPPISKPVLLLIVSFPYIMLPLLKILPNKKEDEVNGFLIKAVKKMIALRNQQKPSERRRDFLQLVLDAQSSADEIGMAHFDIIGQSETVSGKALPKEHKKLSDDEIVGLTYLFLIAGYEPTKNTLTFATYLLATNPECQEKLLHEVDRFFEKHDVPNYQNTCELPYMDMVIAETLRLYPSVFRYTREASKDCTILGQRIPAGLIVEVAVRHLHYNPTLWPEPEKFIPERFTAKAKQQRHAFSYIPFGAGPRSCIGLKLALMELKITLLRVFQKFKFETSTKTRIPVLKSEGIIRIQNGIYIKAVSR
ncbi:thromboxane-A synthase [Tiliqua scincoides]|uniref:thromboxane-A synthase n=1 Tax=Tiliqua scincoides TaxID=71010 RepID=UPI003462F2A4